jgi:hypothetical protein
MCDFAAFFEKRLNEDMISGVGPSAKSEMFLLFLASKRIITRKTGRVNLIFPAQISSARFSVRRRFQGIVKVVSYAPKHKV